MLLWIYTVVLAAAFAMPFYALWRTVGVDTVPRGLARRYALIIFAGAFVIIGASNLAYLHYRGEPETNPSVQHQRLNMGHCWYGNRTGRHTSYAGGREAHGLDHLAGSGAGRRHLEDWSNRR